jgi:hypothetical protein
MRSLREVVGVGQQLPGGGGARPIYSVSVRSDARIQPTSANDSKRLTAWSPMSMLLVIAAGGGCVPSDNPQIYQGSNQIQRMVMACACSRRESILIR